MRIGTLNRRITIQRMVAGQDPFGQPNATWVDVVTVWANILTSNGKEAISAAQDVSEVMSSIRIRYRSDVTAAMRALRGPSVYNIKAVLPDEAGRKYVDLLVSGGVNDG